MRALLLFSSAALYWLLFMVIHEFGHAAAAILTGGRVAHVVLHPLAISRTDVSPNPYPMTVCWAGPLWGAIAPAVLLGVWRLVRAPGMKWVQGLAGFCLIANGLYLASGVVFPAGDTEELIRLGSRGWVLAAAGTPMAIVGLWCWHRLGPMFGTKVLSGPELRGALVRVAIALAAVAMAMVVASGRA